MGRIVKHLKNNYKIIIGIIIGVVISGCGVYAATVIAASSVGYTDNSSLGANNVQTAIDKLNTKATTKITEAEAKCPSGNICTKTWAKLGDYVKMTPTSKSYTVTTAMTGYDTDQTINPSELNLWRVISINSDGTIDLVSEYTSSTYVYFKGKTGYQNYISSLNTIASQYTNSRYTVASRHMGYNGQTGTITDTSALDSTTAPWTESTSPLISMSDESKGGGDVGYEKDFNLVNKVLGTAVANKVGTTTATNYWLASRKYSYNSSASWIFYGRGISTSGGLGGDRLYLYRSGSLLTYRYSRAVRPIITLKSGLTPSGSGTSSSPYVLS